jgi:tetratricopeptide (TPR) repeat protein
MTSDLSQNFHYGIDNLKAFYFSLSTAEAARNIFDFEEAVKYYSWADELLEELTDTGEKPQECTTEWLCSFHFTYGDVLMTLGKVVKAQKQFELGLGLSKTAGLTGLEGNYLRALGELSWHRGQYKDALELCEAGLKLLESAGDFNGQSRLFSVMGNIYFSQVLFDQALENYNKGLELALKGGSRLLEGEALRNMGSVFGRRGQSTEALDYLGKALIIARDTGDRDSERQTTMLMGNVYYLKSELKPALEYYYQSRALARATGRRRGECRVTLNMGDVCRLQNDFRSAKNYFKKAHSIAVEIQDREIEGHSLSNLGLVYQGLGQNDNALKCFENALKIFQETNYRSDAETETLAGIANILFEKGNIAEARSHFELAVQSARDIGLWRLLISSLRSLAACEQRLGQVDAARDRLVEALAAVEAAMASNLSYDELQQCLQIRAELAQEMTTP